MGSLPDEPVVVALTAAEAMTVLAALRQYEPYWPADEPASATAVRLSVLRDEVVSIIAKIRQAAGS